MAKTPKSVPASTPTPSTDAPVPTRALIEKLRGAASLDDAVAILAPNARAAAKDATYEIVADATNPLPAKRGAGVRVTPRPCG